MRRRSSCCAKSPIGFMSGIQSMQVATSRAGAIGDQSSQMVESVGRSVLEALWLITSANGF
jgi:hypothetical protein